MKGVSLPGRLLALNLQALPAWSNSATCGFQEGKQGNSSPKGGSNGVPEEGLHASECPWDPRGLNLGIINLVLSKT